MDYRILGRTGVRVSPLCLGAMMFGKWGNPDHADSIRIIHRALDAGINFIDTADVYASGESEEIVGKALAGRRDSIVLATKVHGAMGDDPNRRGNSRRWILMEVEASLRRLQTDWIDLYQIHRPSPETDIEETLRALDDLVHQGKVRYIGQSTFPASQIVEAQWTARQHGLNRFVCEQPPYSMLVRGIEADVLADLPAPRNGRDPVEPAGQWVALGQVAQGCDAADLPRVPASSPNCSTCRARPTNASWRPPTRWRALADQAGISLVQLAVAFVIRHPAVTSAIIGPRTMEQLESQLGASELKLEESLLNRIDEIVPPGTNIDANEVGLDNPALAPAARRR